MISVRPLLCWLMISVAGTPLPAQSLVTSRINPTHWWVGMKNPNLQVLIYGNQVGKLDFSIQYPGIKLVRTQRVENPNYAFLDLTITASTNPGVIPIIGKSGNRTETFRFELKARNKNPKAAGITSADLIYLALPDRFANGETSNDKFANMADSSADRSNPFFRHGGDIQGITNHIDYFKELGVTAIWLNPVLENDQPLTDEQGAMRSAYHGYAFTDHYAVDRRLGGNEAYRQFVKTAHAQGIKVVQDAVYNHVGINHWFIKDLPSKDWLHQWPTYTNTSYKYQPISDPYGAAIDRKVTLDGWFVPFMPDLNQQNPLVANFLIQHALWTVEEFGIDAWRIDTYLYNDPSFMNRCNQALLDEYPTIYIFGESWVNNVINQSYFVRNQVAFPFKCNLPGTLDFVLAAATNDALKQPFGFDDGVHRLYNVLTQDAVYEDPMKLVTFLDNHDQDRFYSVIGEDFAKYKIGVTWLLTTRGIPSWYYGTEILMKNFKNPSDAEVRRDFPGGFKGDASTKFTAEGRTKLENDAFNFVKKLANYRKNTPALHSGKLMHYLPQDNTYVYFRYTADKTILVATNTSEKEISLKTDRFSERLAGFSKAKNILTDEILPDLTVLKLPAKSAVVLELGR